MMRNLIHSLCVCGRKSELIEVICLVELMTDEGTVCSLMLRKYQDVSLIFHFLP